MFRIVSKNQDGQFVHETVESKRAAFQIFYGHAKLGRPCIVTDGSDVIYEYFGGRISSKSRPMRMRGED